ncbi:MAG: SGNH/GDSL hydrolase family protein [Aliishimia sp.]
MKHLLAALTVSAAATLPAASVQAETFTSFYAFGDSLSDDGKLGLPEPYFEGQFSSGPVWSEIIGKRFEDHKLHYQNLALGGATAGDANTNSNGDLSDGEYPTAALPFANFGSQISLFSTFALTAITQDNPLISVLFGANDIFQGGNPIDAANAVADGIKQIADLAPKFDDFLVSTLPELGDPVGSSGFTIAGAFNATLDARLMGIEFDGINIIDVNQNAFQSEFFPTLPSLGVTNFASPCLVDATATTPASDCTIIGFEADGVTPIRDLSIADTFYLIDSVHPSGPVQQGFADFAIAALGSGIPAPIPLPAGLPMLLAGLGAFAVVRRKPAA